MGEQFKDLLKDIISEANKEMEERENMKMQAREKLFDEEAAEDAAYNENLKLIKSYPSFNPEQLVNMKVKPEPPKNKNVHSGHRARMRQSADKSSELEAFSDVQILEFILFITVPRKDTNLLAHAILDRFGTLAAVFTADILDLKEVSGVSENTARMIASIIPIARRAEISRLENNIILDTTVRAVSYLKPFFLYRNKEVLYAAAIDINDRVLSVDRISEGDTAFTAFDIKKIIQNACRHGAVKIILAHNHPAGTLNASPADVAATNKVCIALATMGILLIDHIIFAGDDHYSFFSNGVMEEIYNKCDKIISNEVLEEFRQRKDPSKVPLKYVFEKKWFN